MGLFLASILLNVVNWTLNLIFGQKYLEFILTVTKFWSLIQKVVKANNALENTLNEVLARLTATEKLVKDLQLRVAELESQQVEQKVLIDELSAKNALPQPMPRSSVNPPPPPPPPPMPNSQVDLSMLAKKSRTEPETPRTTLATIRQRPSSQELKKRKGQLKPTNNHKSPGGTPLNPRKDKVKSSTPDENSDMNSKLTYALKRKLQNFRPPSPIVGSPPDSTFGSDDFSFSFTA